MALEAARIEVIGVNGKYFLISGEFPGHYAGDEGVLLRPKMTGAIDAPVKSLWLPGAFGQNFVDFRWDRREVVFTVQTFDPVEDTPEGWHTVDSDWRFAWDYVRETEIRFTTSDGVRSLFCRLLEEPKAYDSDSWEGKDPHLYNTGTVLMTVACELPFYVGATQVYEWEPPPEGNFNASINFSGMANGPVPASFTKVADGGEGGVSIVGGEIKWVQSGVNGGAETYVYNTSAESDFHEVAVKIEDESEAGIFQGNLQLIVRSDDAASDYVWCSIAFQPLFGLSTIQIGCVVDGVSRAFETPKQVDVDPGDVVSFGATGQRRFRVKINGKRVRAVDDKNNVSVFDSAHRKVGFRAAAGPDFIGGQVIPATFSLFTANDIPTTDERSHTFTVSVDGDVPVWPRWTLTDQARWTLPDRSFGNEEYGRGVIDVDRTVELPLLPFGAGCVVDSDPRRQTLLAADRSHLQGRWGGKDLLYPLPKGVHEVTVTVRDAEDGFACRLEVPQWFTRPWSRPTSILEVVG